ncbi:MAG: bacillithiol biosynthesis cysteine-adding enzyme BshC [Flavobacteriales bacterium]|nr:bacillithiol biosynthesis cysteine-adding enzyme BshC [Flavobacteriales bacterium]
MNLEFVSFQTARIGSRLFHDYISGSSVLSSFYSFTPSVHSVEAAVNARKNMPVNRAQLVSILHKQYQGVTISRAVNENIQSLLDENTFTITTGHQVSLVTGPLYFIYKIISVIALAEECKKKHPKLNFVPVYWMNSEDHDFNEINHIWINEQRFEWQRPTPIPMATGRMQPFGIEDFFKSLPASIQEFPSWVEWKDIYTNAKNISEATRILVNLLFGKYGLVVINQDDVRLKRLAFDVFHKELTQHYSFKLVHETTQMLESLGYHAQVKPRELNLFYHHPEAGRQRVVLMDDRIKVLNTPVELLKSELDKLSDEQLNCFSTNVVTRPLYQQSVLPDIIYVGGPAEVSYWLQYKSMFHMHGVFYPLIMMRDSFLLLNPSVSRKINKLGIKVPELFSEESIWQKTHVSRMAEEINFTPIHQTLQQSYHQLAEAMGRIDPTLKPTVIGELQKHIHSLKNLEAKYLRAWKQKNETVVRQLREIRSAVYPVGEMQERHNHLWAHASDPEQFIAMILSAANPWNLQVKVLEL